MLISYLIYISTATKYYSKKELDVIWTHAKNNNSKNDITGILLYQEGIFMQLLEGHKDDILSLYEVIQNDSRHICEKQPLIGTSSKRFFPDWSMDFKNLDYESRDVPSLNQFLEHIDSLHTKTDKDKANEVQNFIFAYSGWTQTE